MDEIDRIQAYLRDIATISYDVVRLPPFTLFFHSSDALKYFNYAIPDEPTGGDLSGVLAEMRRICEQRQRTARFEFFEAFAPDLPAALRENGFMEEDRQWSMLCTPGTFQAVAEVPGLTIVSVNADSPDADVRGYLLTQREGFEPDETGPISAEDVIRARQHLQRGRSYLGRVDGEAAGVSHFSLPIHGVTEIAGIATRPVFRRRGIAARLTWEAVRDAFGMGVSTACLTAADAASGRVYERVGFRPFSTMLAYIDAR